MKKILRRDEVKEHMSPGPPRTIRGTSGPHWHRSSRVHGRRPRCRPVARDVRRGRCQGGWLACGIACYRKLAARQGVSAHARNAGVAVGAQRALRTTARGRGPALAYMRRLSFPAYVRMPRPALPGLIAQPMPAQPCSACPTASVLQWAAERCRQGCRDSSFINASVSRPVAVRLSPHFTPASAQACRFPLTTSCG